MLPLRISFLSACLCIAAGGLNAADAKTYVYVGTYTGKDAKGIYRFEFNPENGTLTPCGLAVEAANPSFLAITPDSKYLYAVEESKSEAGKAGALAAFEISRLDGSLKLLNRLGGVGSGPCHLMLDKKAAHLLVAAYGDGVVTSVQLQEDGRLKEIVSSIRHQGSSVNPKRQSSPHAHCATFDPTGRKAFICDLGLDKIMSYDFDSSTGSLEISKIPWASVTPGAGPRHLCFHPSGRIAYLINELKPSITVFAYDNEEGKFTELQTVSTLSAEAKSEPSSGAEIQIHPSGHFLYASNRGEDSIVVYTVAEDGALSFSSRESARGKTPRSFELDPSGNFLLVANQSSDKLVLFRIKQDDGSLIFLNELAIPAPVCVKFTAVPK